ncbi:alpha-amylase family glycosyl hydrolase [uncultured Lactobacillus sp.]|uniref:alpha-amylase family glycosyl hydrolase n=1 Tax=uncultured Lactobacillus sp. TaxID=153152 RepID=UPI0025F67B58|nr:alpha-amylase family glycosyl hydrolase [uncultured Lactobacillus sp.]
MASDTKIDLRKQMIYSIFVRNYSPEGDFEGVRKDLDRIKDLGTDIIWLLPIQPSGVKNRKGSLGSPYAISDYRAINPEYGTMEDFKRLCDDIHAKGMKIIIDCVYNHTSPDSVLAKEHPEWFYHKKDGSFGNKVGDWSDVIDLDYSHQELWDYQIETLCMWAKYVDGFRCDVAPMVPVAFWQKAREAVAKVRPGAIWLAESGDPGFIRFLRAKGAVGGSDSELYQAFDMTYDYDIYADLRSALTGQKDYRDYIAGLNRQEGIYPENYVKAHFLENHDVIRAHGMIDDESALRAMTAFVYFMKGATLIYNGEEKGDAHHVTLFDKDPVDWSGDIDLTPLMQKMHEIKQLPIMAEGNFEAKIVRDGVFEAVYTETTAVDADREPKKLVGIFNTTGNAVAIQAKLPEGIYHNLFDGRDVQVYSDILRAGEITIIEA